MNVEKTKLMRISSKSSPVQIMIDKKKVEYFSYLESIVTSDSECAFEVKSRISMAKVTFSKKKTLFLSNLDLILRKKRLKCYIWRLSLYAAETWTLRKVDQK
jgi:hypothetical protein